MKILPLAKIAAARKRLIEKEPTMKIDTQILAQQADVSFAYRSYQEDLDEFARLIIEECAKECDKVNDDGYEYDYGQALLCAAAIRALKP